MRAAATAGAGRDGLEPCRPGATPHPLTAATAPAPLSAAARGRAFFPPRRRVVRRRIPAVPNCRPWEARSRLYGAALKRWLRGEADRRPFLRRDGGSSDGAFRRCRTGFRRPVARPLGAAREERSASPPFSAATVGRPTAALGGAELAGALVMTRRSDAAAPGAELASVVGPFRSRSEGWGSRPIRRGACAVCRDSGRLTALPREGGPATPLFSAATVGRSTAALGGAEPAQADWLFRALSAGRRATTVDVLVRSTAKCPNWLPWPGR
jgi:hypothetical protein